MKKINILFAGLLLVVFAQAQNVDKLIKEKEVRRIETILAADDMQGRRTFTPSAPTAPAPSPRCFQNPPCVDVPG